jgi:O-antigen/teichoic acid export membrane protein
MAEKKPAGGGMSTPARGAIQLTSARFLFMGSGYVISVVLARGLGPAAFGIYGVVMSLLLWVEVASSLGLKGATAQLMPQHVHRPEDVERTACGLLLMVSLVLMSLCWALAGPIARILDIPGGTALIRIAVLDLPFNGVYLAYQGILLAHRRFAMLSLGMIVYAATKLTGMLLLLAWGLSLRGALFVNVIATVGVLVYLTIRRPMSGWAPVRALVGPMVRIGIAMGAYVMILQVLMSLDLWFLQGLWEGPAKTMGHYVAALNIARLPTVVPFALSGVLLASLSRALAQKNEALAQRYIQGAMRFAVVVLVPGCVLAVLYAEPIMALLYSSAYRAGGAYLRWQVIAFCCMAFLDLLLTALMATGRHYISASILFALIPVSVVANLLLIPPFGATGAAISLLLTFALGTSMAVVLAWRRFGTLVDLATVGRVTAASLCMALVGEILPHLQSRLIPALIALLALYGMILLATKEIKMAEFRSFSPLRGD